MSYHTYLAAFRQATEDDVEAALETAAFTGWPNDEAALLEFFNSMLRVLVVKSRFRNSR
ncbi:hypothetical protein [Novosphingobium sp. TCA1]|uniref:hypothetical protein n=1 Tax=Novosphingobium sp. TCA1 TaxID=2682474 RepID=UPI001309A7D5|nr:hypothetical protein [Novosphingobium sp. TCA1]GFE77989.1 hypothetical protein NTCA1_56380 [Novosphingobium sp. TCA1]